MKVGGDAFQGDKNVSQMAGGDIVGRDEITNITHISNTYDAPSWAEVRHQRNRQAIIQRVRAIWVKGVLENSVSSAAFLDLEVLAKPEDVEQPWNLNLRPPNQGCEAIPATPNRLAIFDEADGALLILGAPGAGKTTSLLALARDLLDRADKEATTPVPVVFSLASWAEKRPSLADWLAEELFRRYDVPRAIGRVWVQQDMLVPLLDGLDEVHTEHREGCVKAINVFRADHGLAPLVVCSRIVDYEALSIRLHLQSAVVVQPLTLPQVDLHLAQFGEPQAGLRAAIQQSRDFQELSTSPLMLGVMMVVYQGQAGAIVLEGTPAEQPTYLFKQYIECVLERPNDVRVYGLGQPPGSTTADRSSFTKPQTLHWLSWLARTMQRNGETQLYLEWMQPQWLPNGTQAAVVTLGTSIVIGLTVGMIFGTLSSGFALHLAAGLLGGLVGGLIGNFAGHLRDHSRVAVPNERATVTAGDWRLAVSSLTFLIGGGLVLGLLVGLSRDESGNLGIRVFLGLIVALVAGFIGYSSNIAIIEQLHWSRHSLRKGLDGLFIGSGLGALAGGLFGWVAAILVVVPDIAAREALSAALASGLVTGWTEARASGTTFWFIGAVAGGMVGWLRGSISAVQLTHRRVGNDVLWWTLRSVLFGTLMGGFVAAVIAGLAIGAGFTIAHESSEQVIRGQAMILIFALIFALIGGVGYGGKALIQHSLLRWLLWHNGATPIPWEYPRFLEYAVDRILLRKVGGGYLFVHPMLSDYLAGLEV